MMQTISLFLPGTLACESTINQNSKAIKFYNNFLNNSGIRAILLRGWGFSYFTVWMGFASTTGWICVYVVATYVIYNIRK